MVPFAWGGLGRDALVVLIHTQGIGDNPSKSESTQKDQRLKVMRRAKVKGQGSGTGYDKPLLHPCQTFLMGGSRPATHANQPY